MDYEMSVNDEHIFGSIDEAELNLNELPDQSTLKLLITRLKLSVIELKVSQKLQNNNFLIHIDQLNKKYAALKAEIDGIKSEKQIKVCNVSQQTDEHSSNPPQIFIGNKSTSLVNFSNKFVQTENGFIENNNDSTLEIQNEIQNNDNLPQTGTTIENISVNVDLSHLVVEDENINTAINLLNCNKVDKDASCNLNANLSLEHNQVEEQLTNSTYEPSKLNKIESNISLAINKYLEKVTGSKISIISCNIMNQNEWVVLNSESDSSIKTVIICVTFYDEECFSVATSKNTNKTESDEEKFYQVVYAITQEGSEQTESNCDMNIEDLDTSPRRLSSFVNKNPVFDTTSQLNDLHPSLSNQINQKKECSSIVHKTPASNPVPLENNNVESRVPNAKSLVPNVENLVPNFKSLESKQINDKRKSDIVSDPPCTTSELIHKTNGTTKNLKKYTSPSHTSSPLLPKETPSSASSSNKFGNRKNNDECLNLITIQENRQKNSRNRNHSRVFKNNNPNYNPRNKYRKTYSRQMFESLMDSCPSESTFIRTEKKRLSNVPSITIREHVPLDQNEEEQILSSENDDVFIIEQENHPIEID